MNKKTLRKNGSMAVATMAVAKKDLKVEIMRIVACFTVIMYHTRTMPLRLDGTVSETCVLIEAFCSICVASFFLISGFYIYNKKGKWYKDWLSIIISFIKNVLVPVIIFTVVCIIFDDYIFGRCGIIDCIKKINVVNVIETLISGFTHFSEKYWPTSLAHLWYIFEYAKIIIYYPLARWLVKRDRKILYTVLALLIAYQFFVDVNIFNGEWFYNKFYNFIPRAVIYSLIGYVLYNDVLEVVRDKKKSCPKMQIFAIILYIISFTGLFLIQYFYLRDVKGEHTFTSWYSIGAVTLSMSVQMIIYNIDFDRILDESKKRMVYYVAGATLGIFLLHLPIVLKLMTTGIYGIFNTGIDMNPIYKILFLIFFNAVVAVIAFAMVIVIRKINLIGRKN